MHYQTSNLTGESLCSYIPPRLESLDVTVEQGFQQSSDSNIDSWEYDGEQNM